MRTQNHPDYLVSTQWLASALSDRDVLVFDCTTRIVPDERTIYRTEPVIDRFLAGHIPGAQFVDVQRDFSDSTHRYKFMLPPADQFAERASAFGIEPGKTVVLYSTMDPWWATRVWWLLRVFGHERVVVLDGGFDKWAAEQRPVETGPALPREPGRFTVRFNPRMVASRDEVLAAIGSDAVCTISARLPSQFAGIDGNTYGRPGRIPGSVNVPAASLLDAETKTYLPLDVLRERFAHLPVADRRVIAYCGHGIAASADAFVLAMLGYDNVAIYDASLSEWAADHSLPIEVG
ncbi:sulfurtransferase [Chelatococcus asaccharovorans]|uniref:sulfurtransferase n=1 Tax=Chelatococcus asaccharovorans TaxID=28210 RepID=UPI00224C6DC0|nr:sulfurtransferase [Chelatococcus asaccharovorans]CAH1661271.1 Thiosulfate/3-mercaptopyruvate sulfurtransferase [Chelatococcus asaccharovorans]CAH1683527.1 Thiosulfate/3-mercaptopyruvate sulfurtransferase [Chelatococcus asaccharovorans]